MDDKPPRSGRPHRAPHGAGMESPRTLKFLAVMFTVATAAFLALLVLDLVIGRPAAGDIFITGLNAVAAVWLWRKASEDARP